VSLDEQTVYIDAIGQSFEFEAWEPIHTEYSYKYLEQDVDELATSTGFAIEERFRDRRRWFVDARFRVEKPGK